MSLPLSIRNDIAFRKVQRIVTRTVFTPATTKLWNVHVKDLNPNSFDFNEAKDAISKVALGSTGIEDMITKIHNEKSGIVLEDRDETLLFIERCIEAIGDSK